MAERARFELAEARTSAVFKTAALNHSTISPDCVNIIETSENTSLFFLFYQKKQ